MRRINTRKAPDPPLEESQNGRDHEEGVDQENRHNGDPVN